MKLAILLCTSLVLAATGAEHNFNTPGEFTGNFSNTGGFTQTNGGGITGGAVIGSSSLGPVALAPLSANVGQTLTGAVSFYYTTNNPWSGSGMSAAVGFVGNSSQPLEFFSSSAYFWSEFANDNRLSLFNNPTGSSGEGSSQTLGTITPPGFERWLRLETIVTKQINDWLFQVRLSDLGTDGLQAPAALFNTTTTIVNPAAAADSSLFGGFAGYYHVSAFDNFLAVPEPSIPALILVGSAVVVAWRRRGTR